MPAVQWLDRTQPQTLQIATIVMYINAAFGLISLEFLVFPIGTLLVVGSLAAGLGIANEKKWGYWLGVVVAILAVLLLITNLRAVNVISLLFGIALIGVLLHPQSRDYQRTWFKFR